MSCLTRVPVMAGPFTVSFLNSPFVRAWREVSASGLVSVVSHRLRCRSGKTALVGKSRGWSCCLAQGLTPRYRLDPLFDLKLECSLHHEYASNLPEVVTRHWFEYHRPPLSALLLWNRAVTREIWSFPWNHSNQLLVLVMSD